MIEEWMEKLKALYDTNNYPPSFIWNFDETVMYPGKQRHRVIIRSCDPRPISVSPNKKKHITFGLCISASGGRLQPLCILPLKLKPHLPSSVEAHYNFTNNKKKFGWIDTEIWYN